MREREREKGRNPFREMEKKKDKDIQRNREKGRNTGKDIDRRGERKVKRQTKTLTVGKREREKDRQRHSEK